MALTLLLFLQLGFALWEPTHALNRSFNNSWKDHVKVSGASRHSAPMVNAMYGCILLEIQVTVLL